MEAEPDDDVKIKKIPSPQVELIDVQQFVRLEHHLNHGVGVGGEEGVGMEAGEVEGDGGEVKGGRLAGEGVPLMLAA